MIGTLLLGAGAVWAAESRSAVPSPRSFPYCIYKDTRGVVLTNLPLPADATAVRCHDWRDATDEEIAATAQANAAIARANEERDRTAALDRRTEEAPRIEDRGSRIETYYLPFSILHRRLIEHPPSSVPGHPSSPKGAKFAQ